MGEILQEARLRQKISLEQAEQESRVRRIFLEALEEERFDQLPARAYTQGLLQVYARYLGLDPVALIDLLPPEPEPEATLIEQRVDLRPGGIGIRVPPQVFIGLAVIIFGFLLLRAVTAPSDGGLLVEVSSPEPSPAPDLSPAAAVSPSPSVVPTSTVPAPAVTATSTAMPTATATVSPVTLPLLTGQTAQQATRALESLGLGVVTDERSSPSVPAGTVMGQNPEPGARLNPGENVTLVVSRGPPGIPVPNVVGKPEAEARKILTDARLRPGQYVNYQGRDQVPPDELRRVCVGCVLSTTPAPGVETPAGSEVLLAVRKE